MAGVGFAESLLMLVLFSGGGPSTELASLVPTREYLKARDVELTVEKLMAAAAETPSTPRKQMVQLVALRHLASEVDLARRSPNAADHRRTLTAIAEGKKASDPAGFAARFARRALDAWDGAKPRAVVKPARESLTGLPGHVGFVAGFGSHGVDSAPVDLGPILATVPEQNKALLFDALEKVGNVRIEAAALGVAEVEGSKEIYLRLRGAANAEWLASLFETQMTKSERKLQSGETIRVFTAKGSEPAIALVDHSEMLIAAVIPDAGLASPEKTLACLDRLIAARSAKPEFGTELKADLAKLPAGATLLAVGAVPMKSSKFFAFPKRMTLHGTPTLGGLDVQFAGAMENAELAGAMVKLVSGGRNEALKALGMLQGQPAPIPGFEVQSVITLLESFEINATGDAVRARAIVPNSLLGTQLAITVYMGAAFRAPPPKN